MESRADEKDYKMLNDLGACTAERGFEAQRTHFKASKTTIRRYKFGWYSRLKELKQELESVVSGTAVITEHLKELLESMEEEPSSGGQGKAGATDEAEVKSPGTDDLTGAEVKSSKADVPADPKMQSPGANDPTVYNFEVDKLDVDTSNADK